MSSLTRGEQQQRLARRATMAAGVGTGGGIRTDGGRLSLGGMGPIAAASTVTSSAVVPPIRLPDFMMQAGHIHIPATVTARGYQPGDPMAFEPQPQAQSQSQAQQAAPRHSPTGSDDLLSAGRPALVGRRSTMPLGAALQRVVVAPPLLHAALTPSCDMCSDDGDADASVSHPSQVWCAECDMWLCGSETPHDGLSSGAEGLAGQARPAAHNWRLHRHTVMQGHVRVAATAAMQLNKLESAEAAKPLEQRRSNKELLLSLYRLPMAGVVWECQSLVDADEWLEYDLLTQQALEKAFGTAAGGDVNQQQQQQQQQVQISDQWEVRRHSTAADGEHASQSVHAYYQINRLSQRRSGVRRVQVSGSRGGPSLRDWLGSSGTRPNTRPSSAAPTPRASASASSSATSPSDSGRVMPADWRTNGITLTLSLPNGTATATPPHSALTPPSDSTAAAAAAAGRRASVSTHSLATPRATPRPVLSRHSSVDALQMVSIADWDAAQWEGFARSQRPVADGNVAAAGGPPPAPDDPTRLYPLFDGERGDALLLSVYNNARNAVELLLSKGYSPRAVTSWTHLDALQLACMQGNDAIAALLLQHGADATYRNQTTTMAMEYAAKSGCLPLLQRLVDLRARTASPLSYSDVLLKESRRKAKRSTWIDIAETEAAADQEAAAARAPSSSTSDRLSVPGAVGGAGAADPDLHLYPHLMTEALNVPPVLSHTIEVPQFLLERMLQRQQAAEAAGRPAPTFELARFHEWMTTCVSSSSVERLRFLLCHWGRYTRSLTKLDSISDDLSDNLSLPQYARAVLDFQPSVNALLLQACGEHPASEWEPDEEDEEEEEEEGDRHATYEEDEDDSSSSASSPASPSSASPSPSGPFALLSLLLDTHNADVNYVLRDLSDGTDMSPLLMSIRDRKPHLTAFLVSRGADVQRRLRCVEVDLLAAEPGDDDLSLMSRAPVERAPSPDGRAFEMLLPLEFARDECAYDADELRTLQECIERGLARRHRRAEKLVSRVLDVSRQMAGLEPQGEADDGGDEDANGDEESNGSAAPSSSAIRLAAPFDPTTLHIISGFCFGHRTLTAGATISAATGLTLSRPPSPQPSP